MGFRDSRFPNTQRSNYRFHMATSIAIMGGVKRGDAESLAAVDLSLIKHSLNPAYKAVDKVMNKEVAPATR